MKRFLYLFLLIAGLCFVLAFSVGAADFTGSGVLHYSKAGTAYSYSFDLGTSGALTGSDFSGSPVFKDITISFTGGSEPINRGETIYMQGRIPYIYTSSSDSRTPSFSGSSVPSSIKVYLTEYLSGEEFLAYTLLPTDYALNIVESHNIAWYSCNMYCSFSLDRQVLPVGRVVYEYPDLSADWGWSSMVAHYVADGTFKIGSRTATTEQTVETAAQSIINSLGSDIQLNTDELINIRQYVSEICEFLTNPAVDADGTTYVYSWNHYAAATIKFYSAFQSQNLSLIQSSNAVKNAIDSIYLNLGFHYSTEEGWETLKQGMQTMNSSIIAAIENGVTDVLDGLDDAYSSVDTSGLDSGSADTNTMISESDEIESGLMQSATDAMGDINLDTPGIGSQTLSALVSLLPFYDGFFTASGEVGLVLVFSLAVGIVLLLIGRSGIAFISRVEHASRNKGGDDL